MNEPDLRHHGDAEVRDGLLDLAVNVRRAAPPSWLAERIAATINGLGSYPRPQAATAAVAARHGRPENEVLLTSGGAEAFVLIARALHVTRPVCVHPSFTEPEAALLAAGHTVARHVLTEPFDLEPGSVDPHADLVVIGNPTNPTSRLHPAQSVAALCRPGRFVVVDEAFADAMPGEPQSLAHRRDLPGLVVVRSLTKTWGLAGLRVGYVLADALTIAQLREAQPLWSVSSPALAAAEAVSSPAAIAEADAGATEIARCRDALRDALADYPRLRVVENPQGPFVLVHVDPTVGGLRLRELLIENGVVVRRCDTFPGLSADWLRLAVPDEVGLKTLTAALDAAFS